MAQLGDSLDEMFQVASRLLPNVQTMHLPRGMRLPRVKTPDGGRSNIVIERLLPTPLLARHHRSLADFGPEPDSHLCPT